MVRENRLKHSKRANLMKKYSNPQAQPEKVAPKVASSSPFNVLLVEDNVMAQKVAQSMLGNLGYQVVVADCGAAALELFEPGKYALVFMDIGLPDFSGYLVTKHIRVIEQDIDPEQRVPIVALSAHVDNVDECIEAGMDAVLHKPLSVEKALTMLRRYVHQRGGQVPDAVLAPENGCPMEDLPIIEDNAEQELLSLLAASLPKFRQDLQHAFAKRDRESLMQLAHAMYGGLCYTGTPQLREVVRSLDAALKKAKFAIQVGDHYHATLRALEAFEGSYKAML